MPWIYFSLSKADSQHSWRFLLAFQLRGISSDMKRVAAKIMIYFCNNPAV